MSTTDLFPAERQAEIVTILEQKGSVNVADLALKFNVTTATIRNDLDTIMQSHKIIRVHGGAIIPNFSTSYEPQYTEKSNLNIDLKERIGAIASSFVNNGDTIFLDSGTTAYQLAKKLLDKHNLKIFTTDLKVGCLLATNPNVETVIIGGLVRPNQFNTIGPFAQDEVSRLNTDLFFLAVDGIDTAKGVTVSDLEESAIKKIMIASTKSVVVISDHSKFGRVSTSHVCAISEIDAIVTDSQLDFETLKIFRDAGMQLFLA